MIPCLSVCIGVLKIFGIHSLLLMPLTLFFSLSLCCLGDCLKNWLNQYSVDAWIASFGGTTSIMPSMNMSNQFPISLCVIMAKTFKLTCEALRVWIFVLSILARVEKILGAWISTMDPNVRLGWFIARALALSSLICRCCVIGIKPDQLHKRSIHDSYRAFQMLL